MPDTAESGSQGVGRFVAKVIGSLHECASGMGTQVAGAFKIGLEARVEAG